ncbi:MAG: hypothetical protein ACSHX8_10750 [Opitutaceae bacterium]
MNQLNQQWNEFMTLEFPENLAGKEIDGICITLLDSSLAGCISSALGSNLTEGEEGILKSCLNNLESVYPKMDTQGKEYFSLLRTLAIKALESESITSRSEQCR